MSDRDQSRQKANGEPLSAAGLPTPEASPSRRSRCLTAVGGPARSAQCGQMSGKVPNADQLSARVQNRDRRNRRGPEDVPTHSQQPRGRPLSAVSSSNVSPRSPQQRWSVDYCQCGTPPVITVKKNKQEPQPPQRGVSLPRPHPAYQSSLKRYSCPPIGVFTSPGRSSLSSSSSSTTSSCSSPPPVQTSVITGPDPLGWKLRSKSNATSPQARANRLSLQIPLPVIPAANTPNPEPSPKTKPALRPKPSRRRHSDSSAFLRSPGNDLPVVTVDDLCAVHLRPFTISDESDNVFSERTQERKRVTTQPCKVPPPVLEKTPMARQIAQVIAHSHQRCRPGEDKINKDESIYTSVMKPKPTCSQQTAEHSSTRATRTAGLHLDFSGDEERSTSNYPG